MSTDNKLDAKTSAVMTDITERVIASIESGTAPWQQPWENRSTLTWPENLATGNTYKGMNALFLNMLGNAYDCSHWIGYGQAKKLGGNVRKGEKSTAILAPIMRKGEDSNGDAYMFPCGFRVVRVFNVKQCEGLELPEVETTEAEPRTLDADMLDAFAANTGARIEHGGDRAFFRPSDDHVQMPEKDQFANEGGYYGTLLHELIHWTGHKSRLDRLNEKNKRGYAFEELIAELGAFYASEKIGCPNEAENHKSYLAGWLKSLQSDVNYLWKAASMAERAADYLIACAEKAEQKAA